MVATASGGEKRERPPTQHEQNVYKVLLVASGCFSWPATHLDKMALRAMLDIREENAIFEEGLPVYAILNTTRTHE